MNLGSLERSWNKDSSGITCTSWFGAEFKLLNFKYGKNLKFQDLFEGLKQFLKSWKKLWLT